MTQLYTISRNFTFLMRNRPNIGFRRALHVLYEQAASPEILAVAEGIEKEEKRNVAVSYMIAEN